MPSCSWTARIYQRLAIEKREPAPFGFKLRIDGDTTSDVEDLVIATKLKIVSEHVRRPAIGLRLATKLPNASNETGLGLDTLDFTATVLVGKTLGSTRVVGNGGLAILGDPLRGDRQFDVMVYGLSVAHAIHEGLEVVGEVHGQFQWAWDFPAPGAESKATFRGGVRYTHGAGRFDAGLLVGTTSRDPGIGFTAGYTLRAGRVHAALSPRTVVPGRCPGCTRAARPDRGCRPGDTSRGGCTRKPRISRRPPAGHLACSLPGRARDGPGARSVAVMNPIQPGTSIQEMARSLMRTVDTNGNGELSTEEFTSFLAKLMTGVQTGLSASPTAVTTPAATAGAAATGASLKFEGFDFNKNADPAKSAKYAFAAAAQKAGSMPTSKAEAETWFNANIKGEMEKLGHQIDWVKGDRFQFTNWQGTFVVDYVRGAASSNPALAWQVE